MEGIWKIPHATWPKWGVRVCGEFRAKGNSM
jgi:hypothetical protein